ncbi:PHP domain-containing protein [Paenibacillus tarimensis]
MAMNRADLHTHTTASDGMRTPTDVVRLAKKAGLAAVAITDHDTVAGVAEALQTGQQLGIEVVPGVEISTSEDGKDIHVLGYFTDLHDKRWLERLATLREGRESRNERIVGMLQGLGIEIAIDDVYKAAGKKAEAESVGRPHIAEALLRKGVVGSISEAFDRYIGAGKPAFVSIPKVSPFEAIDWIREAGGTSVIAHPGLYGADPLIEALIRHGADGIEVYHSDHSEEDEERYLKLAHAHGMIITGGSDYHGERNDVSYHGGIGNRTVDIGVIRQLKARQGKRG